MGVDFTLKERTALKEISESENFKELLEHLSMEYSRRSVENAATLTKIIAAIAAQNIEMAAATRIKADGANYLLTCILNKGIDKIDDGLFPFLLEIMKYRYPDGDMVGGCQAEKDLFDKFLCMFKSKEIIKKFLADNDWLQRHGHVEYVELIKEKYK